MAGKTKKRNIEESGSRLNMKRAAQIRSTYVKRKKERERLNNWHFWNFGKTRPAS